MKFDVKVYFWKPFSAAKRALRSCPFCRFEIPADALVCGHCRREVSRLASAGKADSQHRRLADLYDHDTGDSGVGVRIEGLLRQNRRVPDGRGSEPEPDKSST